MNTTELPDRDRLYRLLIEAGFTLVGRSRGADRLVWPGGDERYDCLWLPRDPTSGEEYAEDMAAVISELRRGLRWGTAAISVLVGADLPKTTQGACPPCMGDHIPGVRHVVEDLPAPTRRLRACVEAWPDCFTGGYDPACCRFPKSCSATVYDPEHVTDDQLEPR